MGWSHYIGVGRGASKVAKVADKIVGYITGGPSYVAFIAVHKDFQDKKAGEALMVDAIKTAAKEGINLGLDYRAHPARPKTKAFYAKIARVLDLKTEIFPNGSYPPADPKQKEDDPREHITFFLNDKA